MLIVESHIHAIQAHIFKWVGLIWIGIGLYLGFDPLAVAWRAALASLIALIASGYLLRWGWRIIDRQQQINEQTEHEDGNEAAT